MHPKPFIDIVSPQKTVKNVMITLQKINNNLNKLGIKNNHLPS